MFVCKQEVERGDGTSHYLCYAAEVFYIFSVLAQFLINKDFSFPIFFVPLHPNLNHSEKYKRK